MVSRNPRQEEVTMNTAVYNTEGKIVARTHEYIRRKASKEGASAVAISREGIAAGFMSIAFQDGYKAEMKWASFRVLKAKLRTWRTLYGVSLAIDDEDAGEISYNNPKLV
jgi:hypothetical protein